MAKFLTTVGNSFYIEQIILNAEKNLTLVTPYLNLSKNLIDRLADADKENIIITVIYGKSELKLKEKKKIESLKNLELFFCENLHAKCYHNEKSLIITSMNLYEFSERNNREMGILIEKNSDLNIYEETLKEIESIKNSSSKEKSIEKVSKQVTESNFDTLKINQNYKERWNFHLPSLMKILKKTYPNHKIEFNDSIRINDFPKKGIDLNINGRIDFEFLNQEYYQNIKNSSKRDLLNNSLPNIRIYWNYKQINIYEAKDFNPEINNKGLKMKIDKTLEIINTIYKELK
jgi:hypothetical protein